MTHSQHAMYHTGVTLECPASCLGIYTVEDLLRLLTTAGHLALTEKWRTSGPPHRGDFPPHSEHSFNCPLSCLRLSAKVTNALRFDRSGCVSIGDLIRIIKRHELREVRNIGPRSVSEVRAALVAAGFDVQSYSELS